MADHQLLRIPEVADKLGVSARTVSRWAREGRLPTVRRGERGFYVPREAFDSWLRVQAEEAAEGLRPTDG